MPAHIARCEWNVGNRSVRRSAVLDATGREEASERTWSSHRFDAATATVPCSSGDILLSKYASSVVW